MSLKIKKNIEYETKLKWIYSLWWYFVFCFFVVFFFYLIHNIDSDTSINIFPYIVWAGIQSLRHVRQACYHQAVPSLTKLGCH